MTNQLLKAISGNTPPVFLRVVAGIGVLCGEMMVIG
jgi:hypothetical protein